MKIQGQLYVVTDNWNISKWGNGAFKPRVRQSLRTRFLLALERRVPR